MFDPYHKWLGILPKDQPVNHYRLLGLEVFEGDLDVIEMAADRQMSFMRQYQSGEHATAAAKVLNELAIARLCLLKPATKAAYDEKLKQARAPSDSAPVAAKAAKTDPIESQKQQVNNLLEKRQYSAAIAMLNQIVNTQDVKLAPLVAWGRMRLPEVQAEEQKMQEASIPLCATAEKLLKRRDYSEAVKVLSAVPPQYRSDDLREMLRHATELDEECNLLQQGIADAIQQGDESALPALIKQLLKLKPGSQSVKQMAEDLKRYGPRKVIANRRNQKTLNLSQERMFETKNIVVTIAIILGLFFGTGLLLRNYLANTARVKGPGNVASNGPTNSIDINQNVAATTTSPVKTDVGRSNPVVPPDPISQPAKLGEWVDLLEWTEGVDWAPRGRNWNKNIEGKATREGIAMKRAPDAHFPLPAIIDGDYELEVQFTRIDGNQAVAVHFPVGVHTMRLLLGNESGTASQLAFVDGKAGPERRPAPISNNQPHRVFIRVRHDGEKAGINIDFDDTQDYVKWEGEYSALTDVDPSGWTTTMLRHPWIGSSDNNLVFHKVQVRMLSGTIQRDTITAADRKQNLEKGFVRLIGEKAIASQAHEGLFFVNQAPSPPPLTELRWPRITADFKFCDDYYGAHAPSRLKCPIPSGTRSFSVVGSNYCSGESRYLILIDGKQVYDSRVTPIAIIRVNIPAKASLLELVADPAGSDALDHVYWCFPRFHSVAAEEVTDKMLDEKPGPLEFKVTSSAVGFGTLTRNQPIEETAAGPIHFRNAQPCDEFVFAHAPSSASYTVPEGMTRFTAIGYCLISHQVKFEVWADAKRIYVSPRAGLIPIEVILPPATQTIELKVDHLGSASADHSFWCFPRLNRI